MPANLVKSARADFGRIFDPFVMSLERTPERLALFRELNAKSGIDFALFHAFDGLGLNVEDAVRDGLIAPGPTNLSKGAIGNAMSHRALWRRAVETRRCHLIFEDDAVARADLRERLMVHGSQLRAGWDMIYLGYNTDSSIELRMPDGNQAQISFDGELRHPTIELARRFATRRRPVGLFKVLRVFGTGAYAVSPRGAAKFLSAVFPLTKNVIGFDGASSVVLNTSLDIAMNPCLAGFDVFAFYPPVALPINDTTTSTVYSRPPLGP